MRKLVLWLAVTAFFLCGIATVQAQDTSRQLKSGQPVSGVIDTQHLTQIYSFASKLPFANGLHLQNSGALPLKIVIIDAAGTPLTTVDNIAPGTVGRLSSWLPPTDGIYYVVIYPTETLNDREGSFTLTLDDVPLMASAITEATLEATTEATEVVTTEATEIPTEAVTAEPTQISTSVTTAELTTEPTQVATEAPTQIPTVEPTEIPTLESTATPTPTLTLESTATPTPTPTLESTATPTPTLTLEATATPTSTPTLEPTAFPTLALPTLVVNATGVQFELDWQIGARLSLEVRDPQGQSVHWKNLMSADGGSFTGDTDPIDCAAFSPHRLTQTVVWTTAVQGSYEILVHYIDGCATAAPFTISVALNGRRFPALSAIAQENQTFVGSIVVNADGTGGLNSRNGLVSVNPTLAIPTSDLVAKGEALPADGIVEAQIANDQPYHAYQFEGQLGDVVSAVVTHTSGSLDTMIALLDTNGNLLAINDDSAGDTTDSALNKVRLRHNGTYLIVVTRYAQLLGATTGDFELTVTGVRGAAGS